MKKKKVTGKDVKKATKKAVKKCVTSEPTWPNPEVLSAVHRTFDAACEALSHHCCDEAKRKNDLAALKDLFEPFDTVIARLRDSMMSLLDKRSSTNQPGLSSLMSGQIVSMLTACTVISNWHYSVDERGVEECYFTNWENGGVGIDLADYREGDKLLIGEAMEDGIVEHHLVWERLPEREMQIKLVSTLMGYFSVQAIYAKEFLSRDTAFRWLDAIEKIGPMQNRFAKTYEDVSAEDVQQLMETITMALRQTRVDSCYNALPTFTAICKEFAQGGATTKKAKKTRKEGR